ncbi:hypothetical protein P3W85_24815 [Cupriavidus basilensis]|uniref:Uncharacterized protein n=1 Tax=Cupriavidus basilensis TaxID=68895 RepID=A0ABT6AU41_9BURK|nr:hypothetical protein [Cupriavidus basilensis]MDF3836149.1 hypothetical protein [Cupriavidus basilensis]
MQHIEIQFASTLASACPSEPPMRLAYPQRTLTVRQLIGDVVREQCARLALRAAIGAAEAAARVARQYLTDEEIAQLSAHGRVALQAAGSPAAPEPEAEVACALAGFGKRRFLLTVQGQRMHSLDDTIQLARDTQIAFVRLVPLVGG